MRFEKSLLTVAYFLLSLMDIVFRSQLVFKNNNISNILGNKIPSDIKVGSEALSETSVEHGNFLITPTSCQCALNPILYYSRLAAIHLLHYYLTIYRLNI